MDGGDLYQMTKDLGRIETVLRSLQEASQVQQQTIARLESRVNELAKQCEKPECPPT